MANNMLGFLQIKTGKFKAMKNHFSIKRVVEDIIVLNKEQIDKNKIKIVASQFCGFNTREGQI